MKKGMINGLLKIRTGICALLAVAAAGCDSALETETDTDGEEAVLLQFGLYKGGGATRADGTETTEDMSAGKYIRIYAFPAGTTDFKAPLGDAVYKVEAGGTATGPLKLYRGSYDIYLLSYNSEASYPKTDDEGKVTVENNHDFMYTKLTNVVVQPEAGKNMMEVQLPEPFKRMGSQVITTVSVKDNTPVKPSGLTVTSITIGGLRHELVYRLNSSAWEVPADKANDNSVAFSGFTGSGLDSKPPAVSPAKVLLPVDGTLTFDVAMTITYTESDNTEKTIYPVYKASLLKALLPGMTYKFDFTLTFYGEIKPVDLTLAVTDCNRIPLEAEDMGKSGI